MTEDQPDHDGRDDARDDAERPVVTPASGGGFGRSQRSHRHEVGLCTRDSTLDLLDHRGVCREGRIDQVETHPVVGGKAFHDSETTFEIGVAGIDATVESHDLSVDGLDVVGAASVHGLELRHAQLEVLDHSSECGVLAVLDRRGDIRPPDEPHQIVLEGVDPCGHVGQAFSDGSEPLGVASLVRRHFGTECQDGRIRSEELLAQIFDVRCVDHSGGLAIGTGHLFLLGT